MPRLAAGAGREWMMEAFEMLVLVIMAFGWGVVVGQSEWWERTSQQTLRDVFKRR